MTEDNNDDLHDDIVYMQMSEFAQSIRRAAQLDEVVILGTQSKELEDEICERLMIASGGGENELGMMMLLLRALFAVAMKLSDGNRQEAYLRLKNFIPLALQAWVKSGDAATRVDMGFYVDDGSGLRRG